MSTALVTQDFFGKPVAFHALDGGELWLTAEQAAIPLGLGSARAVRKLFSENRGDFIEREDFAQVRLSIPCSGNQGFREQSVLVFSVRGLEALALLVRNDVGRKARRWCVNLRASLRAQEKVIADPAKVVEALAARERENAELRNLLIDAQRRHVVTLEDSAARSHSESKHLRSMLGRLLGRTGTQKRLEEKLLGEIKQGQKFLPGIDGHVNRIAGN